MRKQTVDIDLAIGDETRTICLTIRRESPRPDQRHLAAQHVGADIKRDRSTFAHKTRFAPSPYALYGLFSGVSGRRSVERRVRTQSLRQLTNRRDDICILGINDFACTKGFRARKTLWAHI